mgnify:CR=1 FL=1
MDIRKIASVVSSHGKVLVGAVGFSSLFLLLYVSSGIMFPTQNGPTSINTIYADSHHPDVVIVHEFYDPTSDNSDDRLNTRLTRVSSNMILATLYIRNVGSVNARFLKGSTVLRCDNKSKYTAQSAHVIVPSENDTKDSYLEIEVEFPASSLTGYGVNDSGLNSIPCTIDPNNVIPETNENNNDFDFRLFAPNSYPDLAFTEVYVEPENPIASYAGNANSFKIIGKGTNFGASNKRGHAVYVNWGPSFYDSDGMPYPSWRDPKPPGMCGIMGVIRLDEDQEEPKPTRYGYDEDGNIIDLEEDEEPRYILIV